MKCSLRLLVLGASSDVGAAIVTLSVQLGANVVALGRSIAALSNLEGVVRRIEFDVQDFESLERAFCELKTQEFAPNAAVNCIGITCRETFLSQRVDQWDKVLDINLKGIWRCLQLEAEAMIEVGGGAIVNVVSIAGLRANDWGEAPYIASKHGLVGLTKAAAVELGPMGIRVNAICPSVLDTKMTRDSVFREQDLSRIAQKHPIGRLVTPNEVAKVALWLCSEDASGVNGAIIPVDGGLTAK
jgi:NAD(P)-dependent dehydrogenase (short-subunit alcohol dehydrogenase family)